MPFFEILVAALAFLNGRSSKINAHQKSADFLASKRDKRMRVQLTGGKKCLRMLIWMQKSIKFHLSHNKIL